MKSWKTTTAGIACIIAAIATVLKAMFDGDPSTAPAWEAVAAEVMAGVGLLSARDNDKSSEDVGAEAE